MPLKKSCSKKARGANIGELIHAGHPADQSAAIAYRIQREACAKKHKRKKS